MFRSQEADMSRTQKTGNYCTIWTLLIVQARYELRCMYPAVGAANIETIFCANFVFPLFKLLSIFFSPATWESWIGSNARPAPQISALKEIFKEKNQMMDTFQKRTASNQCIFLRGCVSTSFGSKTQYLICSTTCTHSNRNTVTTYTTFHMATRKSGYLMKKGGNVYLWIAVADMCAYFARSYQPCLEEAVHTGWIRKANVLGIRVQTTKRCV